MSSLRIAGHFLLWIGFLTGAFVAVRSTEVADDPWSTVSWPTYGAAILVACGGVFLLRHTQKAARTSGRRHADDVDQMAAALDRIAQQLRIWDSEDGRLPVDEVHRQIDAQLSSDLATFCDLRESLIDTFGLPAYARIMSEFALAERTINRMWSASADGYVDEVDRCLSQAIAHLESAIVRLESAKQEVADGPESVNRLQ